MVKPIQPTSRELARKVRHGEIIKRIKRGWSINKLATWLREEKGYSATWAYVQIKECYKMLADSADAAIENAKVIQVERLEELLTNALESDDKKTALQTLEMLNKIYGLYNQKADITINNGSLKFEF